MDTRVLGAGNDAPESAAQDLPVDGGGIDHAPSETVVPLDPVQCAKRVEKLYKKLNGLGLRGLVLAIEAGELLLEAKKQVGHTNWTAQLRAWKESGIITFSHRTATRWMSVAKHADDPKMANVANLHEAETLVQALEEKSGKKTNTENESGKVDTAVETAENYILKTMRRLPSADQRSFLQDLVTKLNQRLKELEA